MKGEKKTKQNTREYQGSITVEATLVMTLLIPFLVAVIYFSFYVHDRAFLELTACEAAVRGSVLSDDKRTTAAIETIARETLEGQLLSTKNIRWQVSLTGGRVTVSGSGDFCFPGYGSVFFSRIGTVITGTGKRKILNPVRQIRIIRGVTEIVS